MGNIGRVKVKFFGLFRALEKEKKLGVNKERK